MVNKYILEKYIDTNLYAIMYIKVKFAKKAYKRFSILVMFAIIEHIIESIISKYNDIFTIHWLDNLKASRHAKAAAEARISSGKVTYF